MTFCDAFFDRLQFFLEMLQHLQRLVGMTIKMTGRFAWIDHEQHELSHQ